MRYFIEIENKNGVYQGRVHRGNPANDVALPNLKLGQDVLVTIKGVRRTLGQLAQDLICSDPDVLQESFDERWQMELGQYLYNQLFSTLSISAKEPVELRIVSQDEHISRIPWALLFNNGVFLSAARWSVALSTKVKCLDQEMPPSPRMLIVAPQPSGLTPTKAETHIEDLVELLSSVDHRFSLGRNVRVTRTWEEFKQVILEFKPNIVYYYGHGIGDLNTSHLLFESSKGSKLSKPMADIANILQVSEANPLIVYLNCCQGDAGGLLGAGRQLSSFIPAVITNYTLARVSAAQAQGLSIWRSLLLEAKSPHIAVANMRRNLGSLNLSFGDVRWMTPVLYCHYGDWKANRPVRINPFDRDSHWRFKLDRVRQFGQVAYQTTQMLKEFKPRSLAYVWYGQEGQGVDLFHQRLKVELQDYLANVYIYEVQPEWPSEFYKPHRSFEDMFTEAFEVTSLADIPARIRTQTQGASGIQTLIYVRHRPIRSSKPFDLKMFKQYLEWWDCNLVPLFEGKSFALLGVSFVVGKPNIFLQALMEKERILDLELEGTVLQVLDEMDRLAKRDLVDFLKTHNIRLPRHRKDRLLEAILKETNGNYEITLEALKDIAERAWDEDEEVDNKNSVVDYNYD